MDRSSPGRRSKTAAPRAPAPGTFLRGLNPSQRAAVVHRGGPLLVVAGAGSGKTRVLTHRIGHLIASGDVDPERVLAITFTNKAAKEMRERLAAMLPSDVDQLWVSTFHSACVRMLRPFARRVGLTSHFTILPEDDAKRMLRDIADDLNLDVKQFPVAGARAAISAAKNRLMSPRDHILTSADARSNAYARMHEAYAERLRRADAVDFDDLLTHVVDLLRTDSEVREHFQARFDHVLVDEFQDTNAAQAEIVDLLVREHRNLCCVGDGDQSIYAFRAAEIGNILGFTGRYPDATVVTLEQNYRSTGTILDAANAVIARNEQRTEKRLWTESAGGSPITLHAAVDEHEEAMWIASEARSLIADGLAPGQIAVLCRAKTLARPIEAELVRSSVPCRTVGGTPFFERREIRDLLGYLRLALNPDDELSFRRCVNVPKRSVGDAAIKRIRDFSRFHAIGLAEALERRREVPDLSPAAIAGLDAFLALLDVMRDAAGVGGTVAALEAVIHDGGYLAALQAAARDDEERRYREESVGQLLSIAEAHGTIDGLLDAAGLQGETDELGDRDAVTIMTIHAAKGLEFPVVFVPGMEEQVFPDRRCMDDGQIEEERRLAYVAMTRAEVRLFLSHALERRMMDRTVAHDRSRFIDEIPPDLVDDLDVPSDPGVPVSARFASLRAALG